MPDVLPLRTDPPQPQSDPQTRPAAEPAPLVADAKALAKLLGLGVRTVRAHDAAGKLPAPVRIGGRVVWILAEINDWLAAGAPDRATWAARRTARK